MRSLNPLSLHFYYTFFFTFNYVLCSFLLSLPISLSLLLYPVSFCFSYICTYVSTQPKILSNSKASSPRLKGGASFHDLDQCVSAYSPFFYRIIHILLHNDILLRLRSCSHLYSTELFERSVFGSVVWFVYQTAGSSFRFCIQAIYRFGSQYTDPIMRST